MKRLSLLLLVLCLLLPAFALAENPCPTIKFYSNNYVAAVGDTTYVKITVSKAGSQTGTLELRNQRGEVLASKNYKTGTKEYNFSFTPAENQEGGHELSVWFGDVQVNSNEGYLAITDRHRKVIQKIATDQPLMCITIDCAFVGGPTDKFLEILDKYGVKCTFFMTGQFVEKFPEEAKKIAAAGHEIGNHSYSHPHMPEKNNLDSWAYQVRHTAEIIRENLGVNPRFFRPPFGEFNWKITSFARSEGILPAPESSHAIRVALDEAIKCRETGEEKTILFGLTGTGYFDLVAYEKFHNGQMDDYIPTDEELAVYRAKLPKVN